VQNIDEVKNVKDLGPLIGTRGGMSGYWAVLNDLLNFAKSLSVAAEGGEDSMLDDSDIIADFKSGTYSDVPFDAPNTNKVLIIDEINRGNISAIFGELITLLEPDKRMGEINEISCSLPYSPNTKFSLPPNLYIIGTMNTADRSVEALDSALRRRFTFKEKMPMPDLLTGPENEGKREFGEYNLTEILTAINHRIELLIDRDHTIGHSYFFNLKNEQALLDVFMDKIIPLLQEYFYNDYGKMQLILGSGFIEKREKEGKGLPFAAHNLDDESMYVDNGKQTFAIRKIAVADLPNALALLLNKKKDA